VRDRRKSEREEKKRKKNRKRMERKGGDSTPQFTFLVTPL